MILLRSKHRHLCYALVTLVPFAALVLASLLLAPSAQAQTVVATVSVESSPFGLVYDSAKGEVFVSNFDDGTVSVISDTTNEVVATLDVGHYPSSVAYDPAKGEVFVFWLMVRPIPPCFISHHTGRRVHSA